uniref:Uncharacterized protein n=1 Tax=Setaria viridis TaxID=4556 RepID=A0A4V6D7L1_SETVI|nr:hypothetical protein SEVIR_5G417750v2 [Setaria viridis]
MYCFGAASEETMSSQERTERAAAVTTGQHDGPDARALLLPVVAVLRLLTLWT